MVGIDAGSRAFRSMSTQPVHAELAAKIQSTLISNALTTAKWDAHIQNCLRYHFGAAMIPAAWVKRSADALRGSGIKVASFIDLPFGTMTSTGKAYEAARLVENGALELDLMPNIGFLLSGMENDFFHDVRGVVEAVPGTAVKIMIEFPLLDCHQRERAVALSIEAGVAYLKNAAVAQWGLRLLKTFDSFASWPRLTSGLKPR